MKADTATLKLRTALLLGTALACAYAQAADVTDAAAPVYRCPGPPVIYTDKITSEEAKVRNCRMIEGAPVTTTRTEPTESLPSSRWLLVGAGAKIKVYFDKQTIRRSGNQVRVWLMWDSTESRTTSSAYPPRTYLSEKTFAIYDCSGRASKTIQAVRYSQPDASGEVVESQSVREAAVSFAAITPETLGESILEAVCAHSNAAR